ncbi:hypothetical protein RZS08_32915, partial [Arthrospira platensis SPKY1]|nr:hypothetical protein [Arthrospira platensis SPKY1]
TASRAQGPPASGANGGAGSIAALPNTGCHIGRQRCRLVGILQRCRRRRHRHAIDLVSGATTVEADPGVPVDHAHTDTQCVAAHARVSVTGAAAPSHSRRSAT